MSGITGWINFNEHAAEKKQILNKMADAIAHRGPDAEGFWTSNHVAFAHRRLIVLDPEGGGQPMVFQAGDEKVVITYDGKLYNYRELAEQLEEKGHQLQTNSDTEVLLHSYLEWGDGCVDYLNGMFAFAVWDEKRERLIMARDHMGVKPLYYAEKNGSLLFGSEIKALLAHPDIDARIDNDGLAEIFALGPMYTPGNGIFKDISELRAGHMLTADQDGVHVHQYWKLKNEPFTDNTAEASEHVRDILVEATKHQLMSDTGVSSLLSGGLDSSILVSLAAPEFKKQGEDFLTYSIDFENNEQNFQPDFVHESRDTPHVYKVANAVGTKHHNHVVDPKTMADQLLEPMFAHDFPGIGEMETSLYLLFQKMAQDATVALTGESADEVFGGYPWFFQEKILNAGTFPWTMGAESRTQLLNNEVKDYIQPQQYIQRRYEEALQEMPHSTQNNALDQRRQEMQFMNLTRFLPMLLDRSDRLSAKAGLEVRTPICDYRMVQYLWNMPWGIKTAGNMEKGILRRATNGLLIDDVRTRKKSAYPFNQDPNYTLAVKNWLKEILNDREAPIHDLIDTNQVTQILNQANNQTVTMVSDNLIQVNEWLRRYQIDIV